MLEAGPTTNSLAGNRLKPGLPNRGHRVLHNLDWERFFCGQNDYLIARLSTDEFD